MSANSKRREQVDNHNPSVAKWLTDATKSLHAAGIPSARLDAELLLTHSVHKSRTWLHTHGDSLLTTSQQSMADTRLVLRLSRVPLAYIIGHKEFYGRPFRVTPAVLVPRPESEAFITLLNTSVIHDRHRTLLDVGTGSGCIGITAKLEYPECDVTLSDISEAALKVAASNAETLHVQVSLVKSDLLAGVSDTYDIITANLPYVDRGWETSPELVHEPALALYADEAGLALVKALIRQAAAHLNPGGCLLLETDPRQHETIVAFARKSGYRHDATEGYVVALSRT